MRLHYAPLILLALLLTTLRARAAAAQACDASPLLIRNVAVWTPTGVLPNRDLMIRDGRVAAIESTGSGQPTAARTIDGTGQTVLPGLVDSHLHFTIPGGLPPNPGARTDMSDIGARQVVRAGVTSGRLHLASVEEAARLKARSQDPCAAMPRLQVGGPGLSGAAEKDGSSFQGARTVEDGVAKVQRFAAAGVDWIAIHEAHRFAPGVLEAIASAARQFDVRLMASGSTRDEITAALTIDPDTLDYFDRTTDAGYADAVLLLMRSHERMILVPTPGVPYRTVEYRKQPQRLEDPANFELLSPADRAFVLENAKKDLDGTDAQRAVDVVPTIANKLRQLRSLGLHMAIGSDAGSTLHFQPNAIWWELEAWRTAGVSHRDALIAATESGARVLQLSDVGHLRPGARGDFVLYRGNVEEGAFDVGRVVAVGRGGVLVRDRR
jgi:imidazolonepropionase-like amidohydrolase